MGLNRVYCRRYMLCLLAAITSLMSAVAISQELPRAQPRAQQGLLDLSATPINADSIIHLDGDWVFHWGQLLPPSEAISQATEGTGFQVPGLWNQAPAGTFPINGYATLSLTVLLPPDHHQWVLRLPDMPSAYTLWANGARLASNGQVSTHKAGETPGFGPTVVPLWVADGQLHLVLHLSNFHYKEGGIWHSLKLGGLAALAALHDTPLMMDAVLCATLLLASLYYLTLFAMRRQEWAALWFGLFCLVVGLRTGLVGERILYAPLEFLSWGIKQRLEFALFFATLPLFMNFAHTLYPAFIHRRWVLGLSGVSMVALAACVVLPLSGYTALASLFQGLMLVMLVYLLGVSGRLILAGERHGVLFASSFVLLGAASLHDLAYTHFMIDSVPLTSIGVMAFVATQGFIINRRYAASLSLVEEMSAELQRRNNTLLKQDQIKDEFLAQTSHELRTPIHGIVGLAGNLLNQPNMALHDQRRQVQLIEVAAQRLRRLVDDILDLSSLKMEQAPLKVTAVDVAALADLCLSLLAPRLNGQLQVERDYPATLPPVRADEERLQQILLNLLDNAIKYTDEGSITLRLAEQGHQVLIEICDTGIGLVSHEQEKLFQPFQRQSHAQNSHRPGAGLGLAITRELVARHGSTLEVAARDGGGVCARFCLPVHNHQRLPTTPSFSWNLSTLGSDTDPISASIHPDSPAEPATGEQLWVLDDEDINCEVIRGQLQSRGYSTRIFTDPIACIEALEQERPSLLLLDIMMPAMNGFAVCEYVRARFDRYQLPIMMLTARHRNDDVVTAMAQGANDYLTKPYRVEELLARVEAWLEASSSRQRAQDNQRLQLEIERRKQAEQAADKNLKQLEQLLKLSREPIALIDAAFHVHYANAEANELLPSLSQNPVLPTQLHAPLSDALASLDDSDHTSVHLEELSRTAHIKRLTIDHELRFTLVLEVPMPYPSEQATIDALSAQIVSNAKRIDSLERALHRIAASPSSSSTHAPVSTDKGRREQLVGLLRTSLRLWEQHTGLGKTDLAERSRIWRVNIDGSTVKTRTLDKYLSIKTLPQNPRWKSVIKTTQFVIKQCELVESERHRLDGMSKQVEDSFLELEN